MTIDSHPSTFQSEFKSYCCSVRGSCSNTKLNNVQKLQNRAAIIVTSSSCDSSAAPLLQSVGWLPVHRLVHRETTSMVYKSLNGLTTDNLCQVFSRLSDVHNRVFRNTKSDLTVPQMKTACGQNSFAFPRADTWNKLRCEISLLHPIIQSKMQSSYSTLFEESYFKLKFRSFFNFFVYLYILYIHPYLVLMFSGRVH